jgi:uncharacterized zinc-type alcohol dehydrogenase-like protein
MFQCQGIAADAPDGTMRPYSFNRRAPRAHDVQIKIAYCGICHSDLHMARNEWGGTIYPIVPGHEIVGEVTAVGSNVSRFKLGDRVGVGCMVDSCRTCGSCMDGLEQYCETGNTGTYNAPDADFGVTYGGYASDIVVDENYVLRIPDNLDLAKAAPLLCAGITTYSPLRHWSVGPGTKVGIVGLGGLGHMGVKLARAMGARVTMITQSPSKAADATRLGAHQVIVSSDSEQMQSAALSLDLIIDCVSADHPFDTYLGLLRRDGALVMVGAPEKPLSVHAFSLVPKRRSVAGSHIGGIRETQEMLDFCATHGIGAEIEVIGADRVNEAFERMLKSDVKYRFVIDMATLTA